VPSHQTFTYDYANRVKTAVGLYGSQTYNYDAVGNRTSRVVGGTTDTYATFGTSNRINTITTGSNVRSFTYLPTGQVSGDTRDPSDAYVYTYNQTGRLASAALNGSTVGAYLVNGLEQRVAKTVGSTTTHYIFDRFGHLLSEANGSTGAIQKEYIWMDDLLVAEIDDTGSSPVMYYVSTDHLGRPQKMTDATATVVWDGVFDPFGNVTSVTGSTTSLIMFPGQYYDSETQLSQNWDRDYDPTIGKYVQSDPIGLRGGINTYAYAFNNPVSHNDNTGLAPRHDPNGAYCKALAQKIKNIEDQISDRLDELSTNPDGLPYLPPWLGAPNWMSMYGHQQIVSDLSENLQGRRQQYKDNCTCDDDDDDSSSSAGASSPAASTSETAIPSTAPAAPEEQEPESSPTQGTQRAPQSSPNNNGSNAAVGAATGLTLGAMIGIAALAIAAAL
jgi:RHS repeat-associated protein